MTINLVKEAQDTAERLVSEIPKIWLNERAAFLMREMAKRINELEHQLARAPRQ